MRKNIILSLLLGIFVSITAFSQDKKISNNDSLIYVKIYVNGLACPFCAYGLEKKLKKIDGSNDLHIYINEGFVTFNVVNSKKPDKDYLNKIVEEAGFETKKIVYSKTPFNENKQK